MLGHGVTIEGSNECAKGKSNFFVGAEAALHSVEITTGPTLGE